MLPYVNGEFRVGRDPELRFSPSGVAVTKMRAVASSRKQVDGQWQDDKTAWVTLTAFKKLAENVAESFQKGNLVMVSGKLEVDEWEDSEGNRRTTVNVLVDNIGMSAAFNPVKALSGDRPQQSGNGGQRQQGGQSQQDNDPWAGSPQDTSEEPPF